MLWLILGVLLWSIVHLSTCLLPGLRAGLLERVGENAYKGLFSLLIVAALVLMVLGWRGSAVYTVYDPPQWGRIITVALMAAAMILFFASVLPTNIKRALRHPQMTAVALWGASHLLSNGELRSIVLFGGIALWCIVEIVLINRRDGAWIKPPALPIRNDLLPLAIGMASFLLLSWLHPYFAGVPVA